MLGPNGAGKTTSFYMIVGLVRPDTGTGAGRWPRYQPAADVSAGEELWDQLSAAGAFGISQTDRAGQYPGGAGGAAVELGDRRTRTERLIEQLNLGHVRKTRGYALSGGERRRVEIARCLAIEPAFILLDEPFSGIDPIAVLDLQEIIFGLKKSGIGVLITDHNVRETLVGDGPRVHYY